MTPTANRIANILYPLTDFYSEAGEMLPYIDVIDGSVMPQPYRRLLMHDHDMTPTLEAFTGEELHLKLLAAQRHDAALFREVLLMTPDDQPVEFGAIRIELERFDDEPRELIEDCRVPLGTILARYAIPHQSRPNGYFRLDTDKLIRGAFALPRSRQLYGRHNIIYDPDEAALAEVVEILPPLNGYHAG